jgi:hypothetical protein
VGESLPEIVEIFWIDSLFLQGFLKDIKEDYLFFHQAAAVILSHKNTRVIRLVALLVHAKASTEFLEIIVRSTWDKQILLSYGDVLNCI